ncbi:MAG: Crp/Fnr family transcriptional regulator [Anaerolineae bacterium]|nr:Crp/Fnr family transcriptional regulator [Anaerolineae bacterium]
MRTFNKLPDELRDLPAKMRRVDHFRDLSNDELLDIIQSGKIELYAADEVLFVENEPCAGLFVLLSGKVQLCKHSIQGHKSIIAMIEPIIMFNEVASLDEGPNPVTVIASEPSLTWRISPEGLRNLIYCYPALGIGLLRILAGRNRVLVTQFEDLSFRPVLARAAKLLLQLSKNGVEAIDRRCYPNHQMAALISTVPEAFSRSLKLLREDNLIVCTAKSIAVQKPERLLQIVHNSLAFVPDHFSEN